MQKVFFLRRRRRYRGCFTGLAAFLYYLGLGYFSSCSSTRVLALVFSAVGWLVAVSVTFSSRRVIVRSGQTGRIHFESSRLVAFMTLILQLLKIQRAAAAGEMEKNKKQKPTQNECLASDAVQRGNFKCCPLVVFREMTGGKSVIYKESVVPQFQKWFPELLFVWCWLVCSLS